MLASSFTSGLGFIHSYIHTSESFDIRVASYHHLKIHPIPYGYTHYPIPLILITERATSI